MIEQNDLAAENAQLRQRIAELEDDGTKTVADQIAKVEAAGDWGTSLRLKTEQYVRVAAEQDAAARPIPDEETLIQIAELEEAGDWAGVIRAKAAASQPQAPTVDPEIAAQIAELESEGKWVESGRLKAQLIGIQI